MNGISAIVVYGAGGHGKVVADIVLELGIELAGFLDDGARPGLSVLVPAHGDPVTVLGDASWLDADPRRALRVGLGIGNNQTRKSVVERLSQRGVRVATLVHPSAAVSRFAQIASGTVVMALAAINPAAVIGEGAIINTGAIIEHDVTVGDFAHVSPNATLAGAASLGHFSHLGAGATVLPGVSVGDHCIVGAGAVVTRNVPTGTVVAGVPARVIREIHR